MDASVRRLSAEPFVFHNFKTPDIKRFFSVQKESVSQNIRVALLPAASHSAPLVHQHLT